MTKKSGLGKGLDILLGAGTEPETPAEGGISALPIARVQPGENQPRKYFDADALDELAESIRQHGILQPLTVRQLPSGYYQIVAGERRWRAARLAGLEEVPVRVIQADDRTAAELAMIENLQREDLNPMEEAAGYRRLMEEFSLTQEEAAGRVGKSRSAVANAMRLLSLAPAAAELVQKGQLSAGHARALLPLPAEVQAQVAAKIVAEGLSVRQTETLVKRLLTDRPIKPLQDALLRADDPQLYLRQIEKELSLRYGRKVRITSGARKGRIELEYYGADDLEALLSALESDSARRRR